MNGRAVDAVAQEDDSARASTGDHAVDEALTGLGRLKAIDVKEHVAMFESIHSVLQDRLADTEA